jgi:hypothetical protein
MDAGIVNARRETEGRLSQDDPADRDCGRRCRRTETAFAEAAEQAGSGTEIAAGRFPKNGWT